MRILSFVVAGAAIAAAAVPAIAQSPAQSPRPARAEARLAHALEGRVAGTPVRCLNLHDIRSSEIIDRTAILYRTSGNRIYVNRPRMGSESLDRNDVLVTRTYSSQLCSIDTVRLYDSGARMETGFVGLGEFVPYTRAAPAS